MENDKTILSRSVMSTEVNSLQKAFLKEIGFEKVSKLTWVHPLYHILISFKNEGALIDRKSSYKYYQGKVLEYESVGGMPSFVEYDLNGGVKNYAFHLDGKKHSVSGNPEIKGDEISFWCHGVKNSENVQKIFDFLEVEFNRRGYEDISRVVEIYYKNPKKETKFLEFMKEIGLNSKTKDDPALIKMLAMMY